MPVREIPKNYRNVTGLMAIPRLGKSVQFESSLERDFIAELDALSGVVEGFEEQPIEIVWMWSGGLHRYTPDFLIHFRGGRFVRRASTSRPWLVEVKYRDDLKEDWKILRPRYRAATAEAARRGWAFHIITEREIRTLLLQNAQKLRGYRNLTLDDCCADRLIAIVKSQNRSTVGTLTNSVADQFTAQVVLNCVWGLLSRDIFRAQLAEPLSSDSLIWLGEGG